MNSKRSAILKCLLLLIAVVIVPVDHAFAWEVRHFNFDTQLGAYSEYLACCNGGCTNIQGGCGLSIDQAGYFAGGPRKYYGVQWRTENATVMKGNYIYRFLYMPGTEDTDGDGAIDNIDKCPNTPAGSSVGKFGCSPAEDSDGDIDHGGRVCPLYPRNPIHPINPLKTNPVNILTGNKFESATDLQFISPFGKSFIFKRYYNSQSLINSSIGYSWTHSFSAALTPNYDSNPDRIKIVDESGRGVYFHEIEVDQYRGLFMEKSTVDAVGGNYVWHRLDGQHFTFDPQGVLIQIEDKVGNRQDLTYDVNNKLDTVTDVASGRVLTFHYNASDQLEYISGPVTTSVPGGIWVTYEYTNQNLTSVAYADGSGFDYTYADPNDAHNLSEKKDKAGNILASWSYDTQDRAIDNVTNSGRGAVINYFSETEVEVTDAYGVARTYTMGTISSRKRITGASGAAGCSSCGEDVVRVEFDDQLNVTEKEYANGRVDQFQDFDGLGNAQTVKFAVGTIEERVISYIYDTLNHPELKLMLSRSETSILDDGSQTRIKGTIWDYDDDGNGIANENPTTLVRQKIEQGYTTNASGTVLSYEYVTTYQYNGKGQLTSVDGPLAGILDTITYSYDPATGDLLTVTQPIVGATTYDSYDAAGNALSITNINGVQSSFTYDGRNRLLSAAQAGVTTSWSYNSSGQIDTMTDGAGRTLDYEYYGSAAGQYKNGHLHKIIDPLGNYLFYDYDNQANRIEDSAYDPQNSKRRYLRFDYQGIIGDPQNPPGKLWKVIQRNHDNTADLATLYGYDAMGNRNSVTDAQLLQTTTGYNLFNRISTVTQPGNIVTTHEYDQQGNLNRVTDAENHVTTYQYDDMGRVVKRTAPDTGNTRYVYDAAGNLLIKIANDGVAINYLYDDLNRLTDIQYTDSTQNVTFTYDAFESGVNYGRGRLTGMSDPESTYTYAYDVRGNLQTEEKTIDSVTYTTSYTYDGAGQLGSITYPDGRMVTYNPDTAGRIQSVEYKKDSGSATQTLAGSIQYMPFGPMTQLTLGNGIQQNRSYDLNYGIESITDGSVQNLDYTPDDVGNVAAIEDMLDLSGNHDSSFTFDDRYQLEDAVGIYGTLNFALDLTDQWQGYDDVGNRLFKTKDEQIKTAYTYDPNNNHLLEYTTDSDRTEYAYDANGNILSQLNDTQGSSVTAEAEYFYNPNGQRIKKVVNGATTLYHYDQFGQLILETDTTGASLKAYIYLDGAPLIQIAGVPASESVYFYHADHLGTPQKMTDTVGTVVWAADYTPFGEVNITVNTVENNFRFAGQYFDQETGLHYNYHRYYDPKIGRYLRADPIGLRGGINLYSYTSNNPINLIDPWGLDSVMIYWWQNDDANFQAAALSKQKELVNAGHTVTISHYNSRVTPSADIVYIYSHGNPSGPNAYGVSGLALATLGLSKNTSEYSDFSNVNKEIHLMGCNIGKDTDSGKKGNQSFAQYLSDHLPGVTVYAASIGTRMKTSSPTGRYNAAQRDRLMGGSGWKNAINSGDLKISYTPDFGSYSQY